MAKIHQCLKCQVAWEGPSNCHCPSCGHSYVKWLNYDQWIKWRTQ